MVFTMDDLRRFPSVSRIYFVECSGNSGAEWLRPLEDPQKASGMVSCSEWTGVPLSSLLNVARLKPEAKWIVAEGADACLMARSIPLEKALDDTLVAYAQNGEPLRPEQGYPVRLVVPGWEGNINVKWLHRLHVVDQPSMTRDETSHYTDSMPDGKARIFTFDMEAKSIITRPAGGQKLAGGPGRMRSPAWRGRATEKLSAWKFPPTTAEHGSRRSCSRPFFPRRPPVSAMAWKWTGQATSIQSRSIDEDGL